MERVQIAIVDHLRGTKTQVEVPNNVPMNRLIPALVSRLGLPTDQDGRPVTYRLDNRDNGVRVGDEQTLAEAGVQNGTILALIPEVVAGILNPRARSKRLKAEYDRMRELHNKNGLIAIENAIGDPPDRYMIRFTCRGIAKVFRDQVLFSDFHRVALVLTDGFPTIQPLMEWLTPIFHPNISANGQGVCIGIWYPAKTLDELVIMLGEMIQYKNYASHDPLHLEASLWAMNHKELFPVDKRLLLDPKQTTPSSSSAIGKEKDLEILIVG